MIQKETVLRVIDNSGVKYVKCLQVKKSLQISSCQVGKILVVSVKSIQRKTKFSSKIKKGDILYAVLVRAKNKHLKIDSQWYSFFDNSVVLINKALKPIGNRIMGPVLKSLRQIKFFKLISISSGFI